MNAKTIILALCILVGLRGCCGQPENQQRKIERKGAAVSSANAPAEDAFVVDTVAKIVSLTDE